MFSVDRLVLIGAVLVLIGVGSSKFSSRVGLPVLVLFVAVGMLAGSDGIGGIEFTDAELAHGIGTVALAFILFDGGLQTSLTSFRRALAPSLTLATVGVLITTLITGAAASYILGIPMLEGMVLGAIIGSTDAAAVFAVLRSKGVHLDERLSSTLEIESGSNDPMAVLLTIGFLEVLAGRMEVGWDFVRFFTLQMGVGAIAGIVVAKGAVVAVNRINLDTAGLYPVFAAGAGMLSYGLATAFGGSGFLAVYLAGIGLSNANIVFRQGILRFHNGMAWLAQIAMFVLLGLLSRPSHFPSIAGKGLLVAAVLIFISRPIAVFLCLPYFRYSLRELLLISWVGLKGAVPIVVATYPLLAGMPGAQSLFDITFFVVLVSATTQGWTLPQVARWLGLEVAPAPEAPVTLEISSLKHVDGEIVEYPVTESCHAVGRTIRDMAFPEGAVVAMIARKQKIVPPRGSTRLEPGDHVFVVLRPDARPHVDAVFAHDPAAGHEESPPALAASA